MDEFDKDGIVNPESRVRLAKDGPTTYEGGLMTDGSVPEAARAFIRFLAEPDPSGSQPSSCRWRIIEVAVCPKRA